MTFSPYLTFPDTCEEAFTFYAKTFGGKILAMMAYDETPAAETSGPGRKNKIIHGRLELNGTLLMGCDETSEHYKPMAGVTITFETQKPADAERVFATLSKGGAVVAPLGETFFADKFGIVKDRFGISWMVNCPKPMQ